MRALGDELKRKLNCTVYIEEMPGKNVKEKMLQLQGHVDQELAQFLEQRWAMESSNKILLKQLKSKSACEVWHHEEVLGSEVIFGRPEVADSRGVGPFKAFMRAFRTPRG